MHGLKVNHYIDHYNYPHTHEHYDQNQLKLPSVTERHCESHTLSQAPLILRFWRFHDAWVPTITHRDTVNPHTQLTSEKKATIIRPNGSQSNSGHTPSHSIETTISCGLYSNLGLALHQTSTAVTTVGWDEGRVNLLWIQQLGG